MQKKKFDLTSDLIDTNLYENENTVIIKENNKKFDGNKNILLTVSVKENFRAEFKAWCARHRLRMNEAITEGFDLLKNKHGS